MLSKYSSATSKIRTKNYKSIKPFCHINININSTAASLVGVTASILKSSVDSQLCWQINSTYYISSFISGARTFKGIVSAFVCSGGGDVECFFIIDFLADCLIMRYPILESEISLHSANMLGG